MDDICTQARFENDIGNAGETITRCLTCGTYQGNPCRLKEDKPLSPELQALHTTSHALGVPIPANAEQAVALVNLGSAWLRHFATQDNGIEES